MLFNHTAISWVMEMGHQSDSQCICSSSPPPHSNFLPLSLHLLTFSKHQMQWCSQWCGFSTNSHIQCVNECFGVEFQLKHSHHFQIHLPFIESSAIFFSMLCHFSGHTLATRSSFNNSNGVALYTIIISVGLFTAFFL